MLTILDLCSHQTQKVSHLHPVAVDRMQMTILQIGSSEVAWTEVECNEDCRSPQQVQDVISLVFPSRSKNGAIYSRIAPFFALNRIFFPTNEQATLKTKQPIRFQGLFRVTNQISGKWKTKSIKWQILQLLFANSYFPLPPIKNGHEFNFRPAQYCINKIFELTNSCIWAISKWM